MTTQYGVVVLAGNSEVRQRIVTRQRHHTSDEKVYGRMERTYVTLFTRYDVSSEVRQLVLTRQ